VIKRNYNDFGSGKLVYGNKESVQELNKQLPKQIYEGDEDVAAEEVHMIFANYLLIPNEMCGANGKHFLGC